MLVCVHGKSQQPTTTAYIKTNYSKLDSAGFRMPPFDLYERGMVGFLLLKNKPAVNNNKLTLIDFRRSSKKQRLWIIDIAEGKILEHSLVAHGKNTGEEYAKLFSNIQHSNKSSLGFYITAETYFGKHGLSMRIDGQESGFNTNARQRAVVVHGANYVSRDFITSYGRLGRSFGCPALPMKKHKEIIKTIANGSVLFIYYPSLDYLNRTALFDLNQSDYILQCM